MDSSDLLLSLISIPLLGAAAVSLIPGSSKKLLKVAALLISLVPFGISLFVLNGYDYSVGNMQFTKSYEWFPSLGVEMLLGIDGISVWFPVLTALLTSIVVITSGSVKHSLKGYLVCLLILEGGIMGAFLALDAFAFYVFWELMLIPMYFLIGVWGGARKKYAAVKFVLYTAFGSLLMLVAIAYLAVAYQSQTGELSFLFADWTIVELSFSEELWLFSAFTLAFLIKVPVFPFHTWLPDAHVEAPTGGSVMLAGVLLKLGLYGMLRICVPVFPMALSVFQPVIGILAVIGIVYGALVAWVQTDIKKLVAYSSVSHLGFCVLGFAAMSVQGIQGCVFQMVNHGISTGALFLLVGVLYDRKHTREISAYGGLASKVPVFCFVYLVFTLSSIGLPLTNGFVGEFLILLAGFNYKPLFGSIAVLGVVLGALYMLSLYRRVVFGKLDESRNGDLSDLKMGEVAALAPLFILVFWLGVFPGQFLSVTEASVENLVRTYKTPTPDIIPMNEFQKLAMTADE